MIYTRRPLFLVTALGTGATGGGGVKGLTESLVVFGYTLGTMAKPVFALAFEGDIILTTRLLGAATFYAGATFFGFSIFGAALGSASVRTMYVH